MDREEGGTGRIDGHLAAPALGVLASFGTTEEARRLGFLCVISSFITCPQEHNATNLSSKPRHRAGADTDRESKDL